jgi:hypothetical protein
MTLKDNLSGAEAFKPAKSLQISIGHPTRNLLSVAMSVAMRAVKRCPVVPGDFITAEWRLA